MYCEHGVPYVQSCVLDSPCKITISISLLRENTKHRINRIKPNKLNSAARSEINGQSSDSSYPNFDDAVERARCLANKHVDRYNNIKDNNIEGTTTISEDDDDERSFGPSRLS